MKTKTENLKYFPNHPNGSSTGRWSPLFYTLLLLFFEKTMRQGFAKPIEFEWKKSNSWNGTHKIIYVYYVGRRSTHWKVVHNQCIAFGMRPLLYLCRFWRCLWQFIRLFGIHLTTHEFRVDIQLEHEMVLGALPTLHWKAMFFPLFRGRDETNISRFLFGRFVYFPISLQSCERMVFLLQQRIIKINDIDRTPNWTWKTFFD